MYFDFSKNGTANQSRQLEKPEDGDEDDNEDDDVNDDGDDDGGGGDDDNDDDCPYVVPRKTPCTAHSWRRMGHING